MSAQTPKEQFTMATTPTEIRVTVPFCPAFHLWFKRLKGRLRRPGGYWSLPNNEAVQKLLTAMWREPSDLVVVRIPGEAVSEYKNGLHLGGYVLATRRRVDCRVFMPEGVRLTKGEWPARCGYGFAPRVHDDIRSLEFLAVVRRSFAETWRLEIVQPAL